MEKRIIECVPNFSEGRNLDIIKQITDSIESVDGVSLLDVDPGAATNRTVVTFAGEPECPQSRRAYRHARPPRRAPPNGCHRRASSYSRQRHYT